MCGENYYTNINIKTFNFIMNKEQLAKLQQKVNRLMRISSDDSDNESNPKIDIYQKQINHRRQRENQTVKQCVNLMNENKQLKILMEKQRKQNQSLRRQLQKTKRENKQKYKESQTKTKQKAQQNDHQLKQKIRIAKLQTQLQEAKKRNKRLQQILINERKKCHRLCAFINKHVPQLQQNVDKLTAKLDAKLQAHFTQYYQF